MQLWKTCLFPCVTFGHLVVCFGLHLCNHWGYFFPFLPWFHHHLRDLKPPMWTIFSISIWFFFAYLSCLLLTCSRRPQLDFVFWILPWILWVQWILFLLPTLRFYLVLETLCISLMIPWVVLHYHSPWWQIKSYILFFLDLVLGLIDGETLRSLGSILWVYWYSSHYISLCLNSISYCLLLWTKDSLFGWCPSLDYWLCLNFEFVVLLIPFEE